MKKQVSKIAKLDIFDAIASSLAAKQWFLILKYQQVLKLLFL